MWADDFSASPEAGRASFGQEAISFGKKLCDSLGRRRMLAPVSRIKTGNMTAKSKNECGIQGGATGAFDSKGYLLSRYGLYMNKRELCFERKMSRASIDNMRNPNHPRFDPRLAAAEVEQSTDGAGSKVLFRTVAIGELLIGFQ